MAPKTIINDTWKIELEKWLLDYTNTQNNVYFYSYD